MNGFPGRSNPLLHINNTHLTPCAVPPTPPFYNSFVDGYPYASPQILCVSFFIKACQNIFRTLSKSSNNSNTFQNSVKKLQKSCSPATSQICPQLERGQIPPPSRASQPRNYDADTTRARHTHPAGAKCPPHGGWSGANNCRASEHFLRHKTRSATSLLGTLNTGGQQWRVPGGQLHHGAGRHGQRAAGGDPHVA